MRTEKSSGSGDGDSPTSPDEGGVNRENGETDAAHRARPPSPHTLVRLRPREEAIWVSRGRTVLATDRDGFLRARPERGLFVHETRLLSRWSYTVDGAEPAAVARSNVEQHSWLGYYILAAPGASATNPDRGSGGVPQAAEDTLELRLSRVVGEGVHEDVDLTNFTRQRSRFRLVLELDGDFAALSETAGERWQRGRIRRRWTAQGANRGELSLRYRAIHRYAHPGESGTAVLQRGLSLRVAADSEPTHARKRIGFEVDLPPRGTWHACLLLEPEIDGKRLPAPADCRAFEGAEDPDRRTSIFLSEATDFSGSDSHLETSVLATIQRAKHDLAALRLFDLDHGDRAWTVAAGLPIYVALFGRDTLTAGWQAALLGPEMMRGALEELPRWQGRVFDDWRDEQPGRMLHEAHTGPLEVLRFNPRERYYGSITTSGFYPVVLAELWHWTGDKSLVEPLVAPALEGLRWLDTETDLRGDGFHAYKTRSPQGTRHQGWKDSGDAIVDENGEQVDPPIATCEEQGFVYVAKLHLSEVLWWLDRKDEAGRLYHEAEELKKRFNDAFWLESEGTFALGLAEGRPIRAVTSNPGHCLAAGIADKERVSATAERLMAPDLFSGWGIRTLSSENPAYDPYSYHRGSVWPAEHGTFAIGFVRNGLHDLAERLCRAQFEAAALFDFHRLPEVFSGHPRDRDHPFPALYPRSNSPQAWSASAVFSYLQALLGLYPYAPLDLLLVDPQLPEWLPRITLADLRVGQAAVTIRFERKKSGSTYEVLEKRGKLHVVRQPSPWSLTATWPERLRDLLSSLLPGK